MARINTTRIFFHILYWIVYVLINGVLTCIYQGVPVRENLGMAFAGELYVLPIKVGLTYYTFYYIIPLYLDRSKLIKLIGMSLLGFEVAAALYRVVLIEIYFRNFLPEVYARTSILNSIGLTMALFDLFTAVAAATTIKMIRMHYSSREAAQQLRQEKLHSELNFLRAQTNPHFLFNTLNNLYGLARKKSDHAPEAIMKLSKILRFMLYECRQPFISVSEEARIIRDYIELEKLRYNNRLHVEYHLDLQEAPGAQIAPLLLLPFVENSFKHGASGTTGFVEIHIALAIHGHLLSFSVENTAEAGSHDTNTPTNGIGLVNVSRQLELLYPDNHVLTTQYEDGMYKVWLEIELERPAIVPEMLAYGEDDLPELWPAEASEMQETEPEGGQKAK